MISTRSPFPFRRVRRGWQLAATTSLLAAAAPLAGQGLGIGVSPEMGRIQWNDGLGLEDATVFGAGASLEFGRFVRLHPGLYRAGSLGVSFDDLAAVGADNELDLTVAATSVLIRLGSQRIAPLLAATGGVMRFAPDGRESADQIFVGWGGGLGFELQDWLEGRVLLQDLRLRVDRGLFAAGDDPPVDPAAADSRGNLSASVGLGVRFGGASGDGSDASLLGGPEGLMVPLAVQAGVIRFDDILGAGDQALVGVRSGIDLGPYFGLRATYWQGVENGFGAIEDLRGWSGEAQFNIGRVTEASTFLTLGYGQVLFDAAYRNDQGQAVPDQNTLILGAGFGYPLFDRLRLVAAVRDHVTTSGDLGEVSSPSDLRHSLGVDAGLSYRLWGGSERSVPAVAPPATPVGSSGPVAPAPPPVERSDSIVLARRAAALDSTAANFQSDRLVTIPLPAVGELYIRYGAVDQTPSRFAPDGDSTAPRNAAPDTAAIAALIRDELRRASTGNDGGGISRADLAALEERLIQRFEAGVAAGRPVTSPAGAELERLEEEVRELAGIVRDGLAERAPVVIGPASTPAATGATREIRPFYRGIEARIGSAGVRNGGIGVGASLVVSAGNFRWRVLRPFLGVEASRTSVRTRFGPSSVIGSVVGAGLTAGAYADAGAFGRITPSLSVALTGVGGPVSGNTDQDEELMGILYDSFNMGPEIGAHVGYRRPGASYLVTGGIRRLWAGSRSRWAIEVGLRRPGGRTRISSFRPAPIPGTPTSVRDSAARLADTTLAVDPRAPADPELTRRLDELEAALARESSARAAAAAQADSAVQALNARATAAADSTSVRQALRRDLESLGATLTEVVAVRSTNRGLELVMADMFPVGSGVLDARSRAAIGQIGARLRAETFYPLLVEGHTDASGSAEANLRLSLERAESVRLALIASGIEPDRITATGSGEAVPLADNGTSAGRAQNRRVEIVLVGF